uniref:Uncharacterized protein n=1 Tax=Rhizophora mucronata TaxID=61149 RepID=A0A2P2J4A2_RHIMU
MNQNLLRQPHDLSNKRPDELLRSIVGFLGIGGPDTHLWLRFQFLLGQLECYNL